MGSEGLVTTEMEIFKQISEIKVLFSALLARLPQPMTPHLISVSYHCKLRQAKTDLVFTVSLNEHNKRQSQLLNRLKRRLMQIYA